MNIIFIISDTFRKDHLGCYGNTIVQTPHLDRFAEKSVVFENAYCTSFPTMPMRADVYTGRFTFNYLGWAPMPEDEIILPQVLSDSGYRTQAYIDTPFLTSRAYYYDRGFQDFWRVPGQATYRPFDRRDHLYDRRYEEDYFAPKTCREAEHWLERYHKKQDRFFLYVDTWDPHEPWDPPRHYVDLYKPDWDGTIVGPVYWYWKEKGISEDQLDTARALYAGEVTMVDRAVGRLIDRVESMGLMDDTAIIFTSDHGFLFGEHGIFGKTLMERREEGTIFADAPLYEDIARVPLIVYMPGVKPGRRNALVSHPDLMPTILDMAQVNVPEAVQGRSFVPVIRGVHEEFRDFVISTMPLSNPGEITRVVDDYDRKTVSYLPATISTDRWSLLYRAEGENVELYDLKTDPEQANNIANDNTEVVKELHERYFSFLKEIGTPEHLLKPRSKL